MLVESSYDLTTRLDKKFVEDVKICVCVCACIYMSGQAGGITGRFVKCISVVMEEILHSQSSFK